VPSRAKPQGADHRRHTHRSAPEIPAAYEAPRKGDWYARIEAGIRPHVYLLRNAGYDTYSSCQERMEVAITLDCCESFEGELERLDAVLTESGFKHYQIIVGLERCSGFRRTACAVVRFGERTQRRRRARRHRSLVSFWWESPP
jgi:hypothetical protein